MELVEAGLAKYLVRKMNRRELSPARMRRSVSFTCSEIRKLGWLRIQWMVGCRKWRREIIHERTVWWTGRWCYTKYRLGNRFLKAQCF